MLSVILPTYNRAHLLPRCIDSILAQDFKDFELLIIDDGSTDSTQELLRGYTDPRIKIFSQANGGVSSARNLGIQNARGSYLTFIDSDDYILQGFFADANALLKDGGLDALFYGGIEKRHLRSKKAPPLWGRKDERNKTYQNYEFFEEFCLLSGLSWGCAKFFKSDLIHRHQIFFDERIVYGEDLTLILEFLLVAPCVRIRSEIFYCCDVRGDSLCRGHIHRDRKIESLLLGYDRVYQRLLDQSREDLIPVFNTMMIDHLSGRYYELGWRMKNGDWEARFLEVCTTQNQKQNGIYSAIRTRCYRLPPHLGSLVVFASNRCLPYFFFTYRITSRITRKVVAKVLPKRAKKAIKKRARRWRGRKE